MADMMDFRKGHMDPVLKGALLPDASFFNFGFRWRLKREVHLKSQRGHYGFWVTWHNMDRTGKSGFLLATRERKFLVCSLAFQRVVR